MRPTKEATGKSTTEIQITNSFDILINEENENENCNPMTILIKNQDPKEGQSVSCKAWVDALLERPEIKQ
ncbi:hypothetical protein KY289_008059 [Solanum tuberosum]|nr:hypothetical protein KY289_008059 [Solanum tuberosum]